MKNDEVGSLMSSGFVKKMTIYISQERYNKKQECGNESGTEFESEKLEFVRKMLQTGFFKCLHNNRKTYYNALVKIND